MHRTKSASVMCMAGRVGWGAVGLPLLPFLVACWFIAVAFLATELRVV